MGKGRKELVLGLLLAVLAVVVYRAVTAESPASPRAGSSNQNRAATAQAGKQAAPVDKAPDVHLEALESERPAPSDADRNLFRFKPKAPPPPPPSARPSAAVATAPPVAAPTGPPPPPPITLKFIGIMEQPGTKVKIAVLSDGQGPPMFGTEGGTVAGRYRVLRIGVESIELAYLDGRGRQTIRLTGG